VGVTATVSLFAIASFMEVADLRLVDTLCHAEVPVTMSKDAFFAMVAITLQESPADLRFVQVGRGAQLCGGVCIRAIRRRTLAPLEEGAHFGFRELQHNSSVTDNMRFHSNDWISISIDRGGR